MTAESCLRYEKLTIITIQPWKQTGAINIIFLVIKKNTKDAEKNTVNYDVKKLAKS